MADENIDRQLVDRLRQEGHTLLYVAEMEPGISDDAVFNHANQLGALLLTADKDFDEIVFRQRRITTGMILVRLAGLLPQTKAEVVATAVQERSQDFVDSFAIISPDVIRIRRKIQKLSL